MPEPFTERLYIMEYNPPEAPMDGDEPYQQRIERLVASADACATWHELLVVGQVFTLQPEGNVARVIAVEEHGKVVEVQWLSGPRYEQMKRAN